MTHFSWLGQDVSLLEVLETDERFEGVVHTLVAWMRGPSELTVGEREIVAAYVAKLSECSFCVAAHEKLALAFGLDPSIMRDALSEDADGDLRRLNAVLGLARKVTLAPSTMKRGDIDTVVAAGLQERTAHEVVVIASLFGMVTRLADAHGIAVGERQLNDVLARVGPEADVARKSFETV